MDELQLVGYTADLRFLVFSDGAGRTRFRTPVDGDLLETLNEILELVDPDQVASLGLALPAPAPEPEPEPEPGPDPEPEDKVEDAPVSPGPDGNGQIEAPLWPPPGEGGLAGTLLVRLPEPEPEPEPDAESADDGSGRGSKLSPRQIQALLRAGDSPRAVAREAETDEAWVSRWLPPIEAEREQVLQAVQQGHVVKARLGPSSHRLGDAVRINLAEKGLDPDDESVQWTASRREREPYWTVTLRYRSRGRLQRAVWRFQPETGTLEPANTLGTDIAWTRSGAKRAGTRRPAKKAGRTVAKKQSGKKAAKKTAKQAGKKQAKKAAKKAARQGGKRAGARSGRSRR